MKAKALKSFTMGSRSFVQGDTLDAEEWRIKRLVGEGLVATVEDFAPPLEPSEYPAGCSPVVESPKQESPQQPEPAKAPVHRPAPKKGGKSRRNRS